MPNRQPSALDQAVVIPRLVQTGTVHEVGQSACKVFMDHVETIEASQKSEVYQLKWQIRDNSDANFLYIARAWKGIFGARYLRIQKHHLYRGRIGRRIVILEKKNGKIIREC